MNEDVCSRRHADALARFHAQTDDFGHIGYLWAPRVISIMDDHHCESLLDYGCGKGTMGAACREIANKRGSLLFLQEYDPAFPSAMPAPADMVTCIDVLEHVETDKLEAVVDDLKRCMGKVALVTVSLRQGSKRNAHLHPNANKPREFWRALLQLRLGNVTEIEVIDPTKAASEFACIVRPHEEVDL